MNESAPLGARLRIQAFLLAEGWRAWIDTMSEAYFERLGTDAADALLRALADGAGRYARAPDRAPRGLRSDSATKLIMEVNRDGRNGPDALTDEMLARAVQSACFDFAADPAIDPDVRAVLPSLQVSAMRVATAKALASVMPARATLDALDHYLREAMPAGVVWWDEPDLGVAESLGLT